MILFAIKSAVRKASAGMASPDRSGSIWLTVPPPPFRLRRILDQEVERGVVDYHSTSRRYVLNGALPADVRLALRDLQL